MFRTSLGAYVFPVPIFLAFSFETITGELVNFEFFCKDVHSRHQPQRHTLVQQPRGRRCTSSAT